MINTSKIFLQHVSIKSALKFLIMCLENYSVQDSETFPRSFKCLIILLIFFQVTIISEIKAQDSECRDIFSIQYDCSNKGLTTVPKYVYATWTVSVLSIV